MGQVVGCQKVFQHRNDLLAALGAHFNCHQMVLDVHDDAQCLLFGCRWLFLLCLHRKALMLKEGLEGRARAVRRDLQFDPRPAINKMASEDHQKTPGQRGQAVSKMTK